MKTAPGDRPKLVFSRPELEPERAMPMNESPVIKALMNAKRRSSDRVPQQPISIHFEFKAPVFIGDDVVDRALEKIESLRALIEQKLAGPEEPKKS
jgi:hypothetical protein